MHEETKENLSIGYLALILPIVMQVQNFTGKQLDDCEEQDKSLKLIVFYYCQANLLVGI